MYVTDLELFADKINKMVRDSIEFNKSRDRILADFMEFSKSLTNEADRIAADMAIDSGADQEDTTNATP